MSANYEAEQGENTKRIKLLREELQKDNEQRYAADSFIGIVRKYTNPTELTQLMVSELNGNHSKTPLKLDKWAVFLYNNIVR